MSAVDVRVHRRKAVSKTLGNERLRRQVITLIEVVAADHVEDRRIAFQTRRDAAECDR